MDRDLRVKETENKWITTKIPHAHAHAHAHSHSHKENFRLWHLCRETDRVMCSEVLLLKKKKSSAWGEGSGQMKIWKIGSQAGKLWGGARMPQTECAGDWKEARMAGAGRTEQRKESEEAEQVGRSQVTCWRPSQEFEFDFNRCRKL